MKRLINIAPISGYSFIDSSGRIEFLQFFFKFRRPEIAADSSDRRWKKGPH